MDVIYAVKFVHLLGAGAMFGGWLAVALFMVLAHRAQNASVVALISQFVVSLEMLVVAPAMVLQPLSGFPLATAIGLSVLDEFWLQLSIAIYVVLVVAWIGAVLVERRIRGLTRQAAMNSAPLPETYARLFRLWLALAVPVLATMTALFLIMVWQPRLD
jgi:uncharacterized membrane protein